MVPNFLNKNVSDIFNVILFKCHCSYKIELSAALLSVEVVALQVGEGDDKVDENEEEEARVQQAEREQEDVPEKGHFVRLLVILSRYCGQHLQSLKLVQLLT